MTEHVAVRCARCKEERWPFGAVTSAPYICMRCLETLAGGNTAENRKKRPRNIKRQLARRKAITT